MHQQYNETKQQEPSSAAQEPQIDKLAEKSMPERSSIPKANKTRVNFQNFKN